MYYITAVAHMHGAALWALHFLNTNIDPKIRYGYQLPFCLHQTTRLAIICYMTLKYASNLSYGHQPYSVVRFETPVP